MAFDYATEIVPTVIELLTEFGRTVTFIELGDVPDNLAQPWLGTAATRSAPKQSVEAICAFVEPESMERLGEDVVAEDLLRRSQKIAITRMTEAVNLKAFDEVIDDDGSRWTITGFTDLRPGTVQILSFVGLKR